MVHSRLQVMCVMYVQYYSDLPGLFIFWLLTDRWSTFASTSVPFGPAVFVPFGLLPGPALCPKFIASAKKKKRSRVYVRLDTSLSSGPRTWKIVVHKCYKSTYALPCL
ncbi:hypothetical protein C8J57DRAFT_1269499 [Mycena rebaudengoi]|nr:hypothetical protein C8J57DRAFT_1269499 [Mycena rebaudengoi]